MQLLEKELIRELRQYPIDAPKNPDYTITRDFMITLFKILYTYQTIGKEILKEQNLNSRVEFLKQKNFS
jgi:hypothetical protein